MFRIIKTLFYLVIATATFCLFVLIENYLFSEGIKYLIQEHNFHVGRTETFGWLLYAVVVVIETIAFVGNVVWRAIKNVFSSVFSR